MIPGSANPLLLASATGAAPSYQIERSLRFNSSDSAFCSRVPSTAGNRRTLTWSGWVKRASLGGIAHSFLNAGTSASSLDSLYFAVDKIGYQQYNPSLNLVWSTTAVFRDSSAWYHIVCVVDTTQASSANVFKVYVNKVEQAVTLTAFGGSYTQNYQTQFNLNGIAHDIGRYNGSTYAGFYLADIHFIDGQALDPTSFGYTDANGVWQPKSYTGTYGTNGFHLPFSDNSTAAALGTDTSGNGNDWTVNNLEVAGTTVYSDNVTVNGTPLDSPRNIFDGQISTFYGFLNNGGGAYVEVTFSPSLNASSKFEFYWSADSLSTYGYSLNGGSTVNIGTSLGKWEDLGAVGTVSSIKLIQISGRNGVGGGGFSAIRLNGNILADPPIGDSFVDTPTSYGTDTGAGSEVRGNYATLNPLYGGPIPTNGNLDVSLSVQSSYATISFTTSKWYWELTATAAITSGYVGVMDSTYVKTDNSFSSQARSYVSDGNKYNGSTSAYGASWANGDVIGVAVDMDAGTIVFYKNGASQGTAFSDLSGKEWRPFIYATAGSYTCNFGQRPFAYTAPSGFKALCTTNLPAPVVAKPSEVMDVKLYTGNGSTQTISGLGFSPDLVWTKSRSSGLLGHRLQDVVRGATKELYSNATNAETTNANSLTSFNSDGFSIGSENGINQSGATFVAWAWDAGSSTVTNTQGSITSSVRANPSAGFSVVTYTGNNTSTPSPMPTVGHGLNIAPSLVISKSRNNAGVDVGNWFVWHTGAGTGNWLRLNTTDAAASISSSGGGTMVAPTSTVFSTPYISGSNISSNNYVAYCFAPVAGYSAFGSYTGNGSNDGPFVYTGMRPRFLMLKRTDSTDNWAIIDTARSSYNVSNNTLWPNASTAEATTYPGGAAVVPNIDFTANGFKLRAGADGSNVNSATYIYCAFAESPFQYARAR